MYQSPSCRPLFCGFNVLCKGLSLLGAHLNAFWARETRTPVKRVLRLSWCNVGCELVSHTRDSDILPISVRRQFYVWLSSIVMPRQIDRLDFALGMLNSVENAMLLLLARTINSWLRFLFIVADEWTPRLWRWLIYGRRPDFRSFSWLVFRTFYWGFRETCVDWCLSKISVQYQRSNKNSYWHGGLKHWCDYYIHLYSPYNGSTAEKNM